MLRFSLQEAGFEVAATDTGAGALDMLRAPGICAVVLDLGLRDARGGEVLGWLRHRQSINSSAPVWVVVSALDVQEAVRRYGPLGNHFLAKPFNPWELTGLLQQLLRERRD
jgi:DNA-binding response OmpR family regulator